MAKTLLLLLCMSVCQVMAQERIVYEPPEKKPEILARLKAEVIPRIDYNGGSLAELVDFMRLRNAEVCYDNAPGPRPKGISYAIWDEELEKRPVSLNVKNVPLDWVLQQFAEQTGSTILATKDQVEFYPGNRLDPDVLRTYRAKAVRTGNAIILERFTLGNETLEEAIGHLNEAIPETVKAAGNFRIVLDPGVDRTVEVSGLGMNSRSVVEVLRSLAKMTGNRFSADETTLRITK